MYKFKVGQPVIIIDGKLDCGTDLSGEIGEIKYQGLPQFLILVMMFNGYTAPDNEPVYIVSTKSCDVASVESNLKPLPSDHEPAGESFEELIDKFKKVEA